MEKTKLDKTETHSPAALAKAQVEGDYKKAWDMLWQKEKSFWDLGEPHPYLSNVINTSLELSGKKIEDIEAYVPGCGTGHEAFYMVKKGAKVRAADYTPKAIEVAKSIYGKHEKLEFFVENALEVEESEKEKYDIVVDRAMLCAIELDMRDAYLKASAERLKKGGHFVSVAFNKVHLQHGPPHEITEEQIKELASKYFNVLSVETVYAVSMTDYIEKELLVVLEKK